MEESTMGVAWKVTIYDPEGTRECVYSGLTLADANDLMDFVDLSVGHLKLERVWQSDDQLSGSPDVNMDLF
jgi:hypothetical protein